MAVREYQTDAGIADYVLFVNKKPVGIIEAKREEAGEQLHRPWVAVKVLRSQGDAGWGFILAFGESIAAAR